ncbi:phage portal protein [Roseomonas sp. USHLN139]|uniref:phage portal protein n=1 Tax=Roseomonas sp. USHLN139 TaxID=3081298 RepID=UPI003B01EC2B
MSGVAKILGPNGQAIPSADIARSRARALIGQGATPYDAADWSSPEMAGWNPWLGSPDAEKNPFRDLSVARIRDLVRNDGWAAGAVMKITDATIGGDFRFSSRPDYRALRRRYGASFDAVWAKEFADAYEAGFRTWATDPARFNDTSRRLSWNQQARLAFGNYLVEGECLGIIGYRPERVGYGRARYATTLQVVDPDRLSNPGTILDSQLIRGGIEIDMDGVPIAYHFRRGHQNDYFNGAASVVWDRVDRETDWGRPIVIHFMDDDRAGDHRPIGGIFTPVLARMRMLAQYDRVELQAAMVAAIFGVYVESPFDSDMVANSLGDDETLSNYQTMRREFHDQRQLMAGNVRVANMFPGEKINSVSSNRPPAAFEAFESAMLRNLASAAGETYETVSSNYRGQNYSGARQAMVTTWKTMDRRRLHFGDAYCSPVAAALGEEMMDRGELPLPAGAPDWVEARAEYSRCRWIGPGRGWVDPVAEPEGSLKKIAGGLSTLEREAEQNDGLDWEETLDQRQLEQAALVARGLTVVMTPVGGDQAAGQGGDGGEKPADPTDPARDKAEREEETT